MSEGKKTRNDMLCVQWVYAGQCWTALRSGLEVPDIPTYRIWETVGKSDVEVLVNRKPIRPMRVSCNGTTVYASN